MFTVKEYIDQGIEDLKTLYPRNEAKALLEIVLENFCSLPSYIYHTNPNLSLPFEYLESLLNALDDLRKARPIQYILGKTLFEGCIINVREGVLIPRPETAELVRWARNFIDLQVVEKTKSSSKTSSLFILDVCTGSGAIAVALAKAFPQAEVYGVDISEEALAIAEENARVNRVRVRFSHADILNSSSNSTPLITHHSSLINRSFDVIISNPPYVRLSEKGTMRRNVIDYEPHDALFVPDKNPLLFYRSLADWGLLLLKKGGVLMVEINEIMDQKVTELLEKKGYSSIEVRKDINGKPRMCCGGLCE